MIYCRRTETVVRKFLICIIMTSTAAYCSSPTDGLCQSPNNRRLISNVTEDIKVGSAVAQVTVGGNNRQIKLSLDSNDQGFLLNRTSRIIAVGKRLHVLWPESVNKIVVLLKIRCQPIMSTSAKETVLWFYIAILDINDNAPVFVNAPYVVNISEWTPPGSTVISSVSAVDPDPSDLGYLSYSIDRENRFAPYFEFPVSSVGEIVLLQLLNYDRVETIKLTIYVKDNSNNHTVLGRLQRQFTSTTTVTINILRARYYPRFSSATFIGFINRNTRPESAVKVTPSISTSSDMTDETRAVNYSIIYDQINDDANYFRIDNTTGKLTAFLPIMANATCMLAFQIKVFESNRPWYYDISLVKVVIIDSERTNNECLPLQQSHYNVTLAEHTPIGSFVVQIQLQQLPCLSQNYMFSLFDDVSHRYFTVDAQTGQIHTTSTLLDIAGSRHTIIVKVTDGTLTNFSKVFIEVHRASYTYFNKQVFVFSVKPAAGVIGRIHKYTNDTREQIVYTLLLNPEFKSPDLFTIDDDGWLSAAYTLVEETYTMAVVAHYNGPRDAALVVIHVQDLLTTALDESNHVALVSMGVVSGCLLLLILLLITCLIGRYFRNVGVKACGSRDDNDIPTTTGFLNGSSVARRQQHSSSNAGVTRKTSSANSISSESNVNNSYHADTNGRNTSEVDGTGVTHSSLPPESIKSCSTASQLSTVDEKLDYEESFTNDLDPSVVGSTVTLMGQMPDTRYDESLQGNNIPSPDGSLMSIGTQPRTGEAPGITVYY